MYFRNANGQVDCLTEPYSAHESDFEPVLGYFLREDISEKRLYIYVSDEHENLGEYLLADFTLDVEDIMPNAHGGAQGGIPMSITQLDILPDDRKKYTLRDGTTVTEGIGKENGQLRVYGDIGNGITYSYHCHADNENQNGCLETLNIEELQLQKIKIFPNPNTRIIKFSKLEHYSCKVYNILGKEMKYHFSEENQEIDISHLKSGIYFLQIQGNDDFQRVVKVIKN